MTEPTPKRELDVVLRERLARALARVLGARLRERERLHDARGGR